MRIERYGQSGRPRPAAARFLLGKPMTGNSDVKATQVWDFSPRARVACMALSAVSGRTLVATEDGRGHVLDRKGKLLSSITFQGQVTCADASDDGRPRP